MLDIARPQHLKLLFKFPVSLVFYCTLVSWAVRFLCCAVYVCVCLVDTKAGCCFEEQKVCKWAKQKKKSYFYGNNFRSGMQNKFANNSRGRQACCQLT